MVNSFLRKLKGRSDSSACNKLNGTIFHEPRFIAFIELPLGPNSPKIDGDNQLPFLRNFQNHEARLYLKDNRPYKE